MSITTNQARYLRRERFIGSCRPKVSQVARIEQKNLIAIEG